MSLYCIVPKGWNFLSKKSIVVGSKSNVICSFRLLTSLGKDSCRNFMLLCNVSYALRFGCLRSEDRGKRNSEVKVKPAFAKVDNHFQFLRASYENLSQFSNIALREVLAIFEHHSKNS